MHGADLPGAHSSPAGPTKRKRAQNRVLTALLPLSSRLRGLSPAARAAAALLLAGAGACGAAALLAAGALPVLDGAGPSPADPGGGATALSPSSAAADPARLERVREMFSHAWRGYADGAWGHDELRPVSNKTNDSWGGWGVTILDALDTLALLGLSDELAAARRHVAALDWSHTKGDHSVFETTIRHLGGLLGAYTLTGDRLYRDKAVQLADRLLPAFRTPSGALLPRVDIRTGKAKPAYVPSLAEVGSVQLEFTYLSQLTGNSSYALAANRFFEIIWDLRGGKRSLSDIERQTEREAPPGAPRPRLRGRGESPQRPGWRQPIKGLWPLSFDPDHGRFDGDIISFGGQGDSFYEYLLKLWVLEGKREDWLWDMYEDAIDGMRRALIRTSRPNGWTYLSSWSSGQLTHEMDHLACFVPAMLALGVAEAPAAAAGAVRAHLTLSRELTQTCVGLYRAMPTGIGPEIAEFQPNDGSGYATQRRGDFVVKDGKYQLRPEVLESLFLLHRVTGDPQYREHAWRIFLALEASCRTPAGYSGLKDVRQPRCGAPDPPHKRLRGTGRGSEAACAQNWDNSMQSFFFAETMKYLWLIFSDSSLLPLSDYVLSTEAHPFRRGV
eukprot:TRINITY_DN9450_c0_g3_i1.p1 TRINITY_DN9450_c0_g3~~TRINITY_DN9450_c0_g3_i1.p1  ORF type:complete len:614 (+),score=111.09 TRINITY_DN9450_c0_g3_i1:88-1929(+)